MTARRWWVAAGAAVLALAVLAPDVQAAYYVSSTAKITAGSPSVATSGSFAYSGGTTTCASTKPCLKVAGSFKSNGTSSSGYVVISYYRNTISSTTGGTLLGSVTSPSFSIPTKSTSTFTKTLAYQCRTVSTTTTVSYYYAIARYMNTSGSWSSDAYPASAVLKAAKSCLS